MRLSDLIYRARPSAGAGTLQAVTTPDPGGHVIPLRPASEPRTGEHPHADDLCPTCDQGAIALAVAETDRALADAEDLADELRITENHNTALQAWADHADTVALRAYGLLSDLAPSRAAELHDELARMARLRQAAATRHPDRQRAT